MPEHLLHFVQRVAGQCGEARRRVSQVMYPRSLQPSPGLPRDAGAAACRLEDTVSPVGLPDRSAATVTEHQPLRIQVPAHLPRSVVLKMATKLGTQCARGVDDAHPASLRL